MQGRFKQGTFNPLLRLGLKGCVLFGSAQSETLAITGYRSNLKVGDAFCIKHSYLLCVTHLTNREAAGLGNNKTLEESLYPLFFFLAHTQVKTDIYNP